MFGPRVGPLSKLSQRKDLERDPISIRAAELRTVQRTVVRSQNGFLQFCSFGAFRDESINKLLIGIISWSTRYYEAPMFGEISLPDNICSLKKLKMKK